MTKWESTLDLTDYGAKVFVFPGNVHGGRGFLTPFSHLKYGDVIYVEGLGKGYLVVISDATWRQGRAIVRVRPE